MISCLLAVLLCGQLTENEFESLRSQFVTSNKGGLRYLPFAFTEQGLAMLWSVLNSEIAIDVNLLYTCTQT